MISSFRRNVLRAQDFILYSTEGRRLFGFGVSLFKSSLCRCEETESNIKILADRARGSNRGMIRRFYFIFSFLASNPCRFIFFPRA